MDGDLVRQRMLQQEQVKLLYAALPTAALATLINVSVLVAIMWSVVDHFLATVWLVVMLSITAARYGLFHGYRNAADEDALSHRWVVYFNIGTVAAATAWGSSALFLFPDSSIVHQVFLAFVVGGLCAGSITTLSPLALPVFSFLGLALTPLIVRFLMVDTELAYAMSGLMLVFLVMVSVAALRVHRNTSQNIQLRMQSQLDARALAESEERFRELFEGNRSVELIIDPDSGDLIEANRAAEQFYGYERSRLLSMNISDINTLSKQEISEQMALARAEQRNSFLFRHRLASGEVRDVEVHSGPLMWNRKRVLYSIVHDVTERARAEFFIKRTSEILEKMAVAGPEEKEIIDAICRTCEQMHPQMRVSVLKLKGKQLYHCSAPSLPDEYCRAIDGMEIGSSAASAGTAAFLGKRVVVEDIATDPLWSDYREVALSHQLCACWAEPIVGQSGSVIGIFAIYYDRPAMPSERDISEIRDGSRLVSIIMERNEREALLRKLSQATEQAGESVLITDKHGKIEYVNPSFTRITGYTAEDVLGENPRILKSGNQSDLFYENLWATISRGEVWHSAVIDRRKDGSEYPALMTISPIFNERGEITHYVGVQQDMTAHEMLEEKFRQAQKMEALGTLVGGIAHDFNNMLAGMIGNLYLIKKSITDPSITKKLDIVEELGFSAADMIKQLLVFARKGTIKMHPFGLTSFIKEVSKLNKASIPENIRFRSAVCQNELVVRGDATQMQQVIMNLLNNARDAVAGVEDPEIALQIDEFEADAAFIEAHSGLSGSLFAHLIISDNGAGISDEDREHIFEPFFSTKEVGLGTGLGLSMVYGAVEAHGGVVEVESRPGNGTSFHIYLPVIEEKAMAPDICEVHNAEAGRGELILVVDDNAEVRETTKEVLESIGYQVIEAVDGLQAVKQFEEHKEVVSLVIMDVVMPRLGGVKAVERIREICPDAKVIFASGYDKDETLRDEMPTGEFELISKPYNIVELSLLVREKLNS